MATPQFHLATPTIPGGHPITISGGHSKGPPEDEVKIALIVNNVNL